MERVKAVCKEGLENFAKSIKEINRMLYIGKVSRYYKFTIGPYDILYDQFNHNIFFQKYSSGTIVEKLNVNDPSLYIHVFIVG